MSNKEFYSKDFKLGVLGGGQLGRMLIQEAIDLDVNVSILDPAANAPCADIANEFVVGNFNDYQTVLDFGKDKDLLTIEIEHVNIDALEQLEKEGVKVYPQPSVLRIVQDKGLQKQFYKDHNIPTSSFYLCENKVDVYKHESEFPFVQKLRTGGYDGRGVQVLKTIEQMDKAFDAPCVLEKFVDFEKEISVIISRNPSGEVSTYPVVELEFNPEANLVEFLFSPGNVTESVAEKAEQIATKLVNDLDFVGLLAVEMFVRKDGEVLVNEIAPRPHNSGHHTIEANVTSQYEQHLRSILDLPLGDVSIVKPAVMLNLLGEKGFTGPVKYEGMKTTLARPGVYVHIYGKADTKPFRKMGHVTVLGNTIEEAIKSAQEIKDSLKVVS